MKKIKEVLSDNNYMKHSIFIAFTAALLYILYFIISNFDNVFLVAVQVLGSLGSAFAPLFIGLLLAYLLNPLADFLRRNLVARLLRIDHAVSANDTASEVDGAVSKSQERDAAQRAKKQKRARLISVLLTYLLIIVIICLIVYAFAVLIVGSFSFDGIESAANSIIAYFQSNEDVIRGWVGSLPEGVFSDKINELVNSIVSWFSNNFSTSGIINFVSGIVGSIANVFIGIMISIYLLYDKDFFLGLWRSFLRLALPEKASLAINGTLTEINGVVSKFVRGALLDALIVAILSSIGLSIMKLDFAVFIGCFAGLTNVIPYFGPFIGMIPAFLVGTITGGLSQGIIAVLVLFAVQQIDSNLIYPRVVGSSTGLHPLFVLLAVTIGGHYGGIVAMIIAVPIAGILKVFIQKWASWAEQRRAAS